MGARLLITIPGAIVAIYVVYSAAAQAAGVSTSGVDEPVFRSESNGEQLYNGIVLPEVWPPRDLDPESDEPMPVPYLDHPPTVIPVDVGRQLFVDDFLIEQSTLTRTFHEAKKYEGNPVFRAETALELAPSKNCQVPGQAGTVYLGHGGVFYDPDKRLFRMYYTAGWRGGLALATSTDMIHWRRPALRATGDNLVLPPGLRWNGSELAVSGSDNCVWLDLNAQDPAERFKYLTCWCNVAREDRPKGFCHTLHVSDGHNWSPGSPTGNAGDYCCFFYNPFRDRWVFSIKQNGPRGRARYYSENKDFLAGADWSQAVYWCNADRLDKPEPEGSYPNAGEQPQLYSLTAVAYESLLVGVHYIHRGPNNSICQEGSFPKLTDLELGFSRDGFHWDRPDRSGFIAASRKAGSWDRGYAHSTTGVFAVVDDKLVFPYTAFSGVAPTGERGMYTGGSIGVALLRRDGFASMDSDETEGVLTTRPITFSGKHLFVNLNAPNGRMTVELLDDARRVLASSDPVSCDQTKKKVTWSDGADLSRFSGLPVRLRFRLTNGELYSFWVTADESGASNGYLGAGGPGYPGVRDVPPRGGQ